MTEMTEQKLKNVLASEVRQSTSYEAGGLYWKKTGKRVGRVEPNGYRRFFMRFDGKLKPFLEHRVIWMLHNGFIPKSVHIDHINQNKLDNRIENLRIATRSQNAANTKPMGGTSKWRGVCKIKRCGNWKAQIFVQGKSIYLGKFKNEEDAAQAYNFAAIKHFGEFASENEA